MTSGERIKLLFVNQFRRYYDDYNTQVLQANIAVLRFDGENDGILQRAPFPDGLTESWRVINNPGGGDCLFFAISMILNSNLIVNNSISNSTFTDGGFFTNPSLRRCLADPVHGLADEEIAPWNDHRYVLNYEVNDPMRLGFNFLIDKNGRWIGDNPGAVRDVIRQNSKYWGDEKAIAALERYFQIKFIIIDTTQRVNPIPVGTNVSFIPNPANGLVLQGIITSSTANIGQETTYRIEDSNYSIYENMATINNQIQISASGYYTTIVTPDLDQNIGANNFTNFAFLLLTIEQSGAQHYEIMYSDILNKFIYTFDEIPDYLKYLVFKSQWKFATPNTRAALWYSYNDAFRAYLIDAQQTYLHAKQQHLLANPQQAAASNVQRAGQGLKSKDRYLDIKRRTSTYDSKLTYYVIIDLELYPGESIPLYKQPMIACQLRYEKIRQAYADMFGLVYQPLEAYHPGTISPSSIKYNKKEDEYEYEMDKKGDRRDYDRRDYDRRDYDRRDYDRRYYDRRYYDRRDYDRREPYRENYERGYRNKIADYDRNRYTQKNNYYPRQNITRRAYYE